MGRAVEQRRDQDRVVGKKEINGGEAADRRSSEGVAVQVPLREDRRLRGGVLVFQAAAAESDEVGVGGDASELELQRACS